MKITKFLITLLLLSSTVKAEYGTHWKFNSGSGIAATNSTWGVVAQPKGNQVALIQGKGSFEQSFTVAKDGDYTVTFSSQDRPFVSLGHDFSVLIDGKEIGRIDKTKQSWNKWTNQSFVSTLISGTHILKFVGLNTIGGDHSSFINDISINDVTLLNGGFDDTIMPPPNYFLYTPQMDDSPGLTIDARVGSTGRALYFTVIKKIDKSIVSVPITSFNASISADGNIITSKGKPVTTNHHVGYIVELNSQIKQGQTITLTLVEGALKTPYDYSEALTNKILTNNVGRSFVRDDTESHVMKAGYNVTFGNSTEWGTFSVLKNLRYRASWGWSGNGWDNTGKPTSFSQRLTDIPIIVNNVDNGIDNTKYWCPHGVYAVTWKDDSTDPDIVSLVGHGDYPATQVIERKDLANPDKKIKAFEFSTTGSTVNTAVQLRIAKANGQPGKVTSYDHVILKPGDFTYTDNTPITLDTSDPLALSETFKQQMPTDIDFGAFRFGEPASSWAMNSSVCEPEHTHQPNAWTYNAKWQASWIVRYTQARPWTKDNSPYVYSAQRGFGTPFPVTLGNDVTTTPPSGTKETWTFPNDSIIVGLVLQDKGEASRVISVSGTSVVVERGSENTTPVAHSAGQVMLSGRTAINDLSFFRWEHGQVVEFVCSEPHKLRTGMVVTFNGGGPFNCTDGSVMGSLWNISSSIFVTGPNTFFIIGAVGKASGQNTTLSTTYTFDPTKMYSQIFLPELPNFPIETICSIASRYPKTRIRVNIPQAFSRSLVYDAARRFRDNTKPGSEFWLEYSNETWNWSSTAAQFTYAMDWLALKQPPWQSWTAHCTAEIKKIFIEVFNETGRSNEVKSTINIQSVSPEIVNSLLTRTKNEGAPTDAIMMAPYIAIDTPDRAVAPELIHAFNTWNLEACVDLWIYDLWFNTQSIRFNTGRIKKAVDDWNKANNTNTTIHCYEGGLDKPWPIVNVQLTTPIDNVIQTITVNNSGQLDIGQYLLCQSEWLQIQSIIGNTLTVLRGQNNSVAKSHPICTMRNAWFESSRDLVYNPYFYIAMQDYLASLEKNGITDYTDGGFSQPYNGGALWGVYRHMDQLPGRGDGSDNRLDNRLTLASPGYPNSKLFTTNLDQHTVSVIGAAIKNWNIAVPLTPVLFAKSTSPSTVTLSWNAIDKATSYYLQRSIDNINWLPLINVSATTYNDKNLTSNTTYYYRIVAFGDGGYSAYSNSVSLITPIDPVVEITTLINELIATQNQLQMLLIDDRTINIRKEINDLITQVTEELNRAKITKQGLGG